jgi:hypothetical protein
METFKFKTKSITGNTPLADLRAIWLPNTSNEVLKSLLFFDTFVKYSYKNYQEFLIAKRIDASQINDIKQLLCIIRELREMWLYNFVEQQRQPFNLHATLCNVIPSGWTTPLEPFINFIENGSQVGIEIKKSDTLRIMKLMTQ